MLTTKIRELSHHLAKPFTASVIVLAVGAVSFSYFANRPTQAQVVEQTVQTFENAKAEQINKKTIGDYAPRTGFADLIEQVSPSVVHVSLIGTPKSNRLLGAQPDFSFPPGSPFEEFFKRYQQRPDTERKQRKTLLGIGSGFFISADGYLVTNNHVVDGGEEIKITLEDGREYTGKLVGADKKTDLAVVKVDVDQEVPFVNWGDDQQSRIGDWVIAIGHPFGLEGSASASTGIISARGRDIRSGPYDDYIQVDAAINRGNSGGPLFNLDGQVIGINTAIYSPNGGNVGIGFSIPSTLAQRIVAQLIDKGSVERGLIGVQIQSLSDDLAESFGLKNKDGALVTSVVPGKPAEEAGIQAGDIITKFDGKKVKEMRDLPRIVADTEVGKTVSIQLLRDGKTVKKKIKVARFDEDQLAVQEQQSQDDDDLGAKLVAIDDDVRAQYDLPEDIKGVLIEQTTYDGLARSNGLQAGDIIQKIGRKDVSSVKDALKQIEKARKDGLETLAMLIYRDNNVRFIPFRFD